MPMILNIAVPVLVKVTVCAVPVMPRTSFPNARLVVESVISIGDT
jgi:hypothetical protein